ncbi:MAG: 50S ribosomal protein L16 [Parcubacteria group bacterium RIFCSPLOWO2_01_FULL_48_18]|nr:ribosomal protein L16 [uncultured bacterium]OHB22314.1 MAG: 50S ribosomal protein L16 [Parcubacteria group bacterium RIFCSPLOWO2_01_FULL_48_18]OHB24154.1 MAG: 50S ribosomal protein L16 [Parcubacteria group bacterium RIFCSPHIGHO2_02_FULL_48_10b]
MLLPKKVKHRKWQKGRSRNRKIETRGTELSFGNFGLKSLTSAWITSRQIESARKAITFYSKKSGKMWIRIFPDKPVTKQAPEKTLGGGKGSVDHYVVPVRPGRVLFEVDGLDEVSARAALRNAGFKLPVKTKIVKR